MLGGGLSLKLCLLFTFRGVRCVLSMFYLAVMSFFKNKTNKHTVGSINWSVQQKSVMKHT